MNTLFIMICLATIVVNIVDISDFPYSVKKVISYVLTKGKMTSTDFRLHLIDCSWCISSWANLIYLVCVGKFTIPFIAATFIIATLTPVIKDLIILMKDLIIKAINKIYDLIQ